MQIAELCRNRKNLRKEVNMKNFKFLDRFKNFIEQNGLLIRNEKIIVGFSGGADSTALLLCLWKLHSHFGYSLLAAHVNYNLRGKDSGNDVEFVKQFCFDRNISLVIKEVKPDSAGTSEAKARNIRMEYFDVLQKQYKADKIALGHNIGDQAETLIYRFMRGTGYAGLKGILPKSENIIHPLIQFSKDDIKKFLQSEKLAWCEDKTNSESVFARNKIRNNILPWIKEELNPKIEERLSDAAEVFRETDEILTELAKRRLMKAMTKHNNDQYKLSLRVLRNTRSVLRFYVYLDLYTKLSGTNKDFYTSNFREIEGILYSKGCKQIKLPNNVFVFKEYTELIFSNFDIAGKTDVLNTKEIPSIRSRFTFEESRIIMKKLKKMPFGRNAFEDRFTAYIDLDKTSFPITIRHRKNGDKFYPLGLKHSKKLKDFFIDEKVSKFDRDKILIFCDEEKILWVAGQRLDARAAATKDSDNILMIKMEKLSTQKTRAAERF